MQAQVIIGVDPHKLSATIEVINGSEQVLGSGRFTTDKAGYRAMLDYVCGWADPVWAVEGSNGAGRSLAQRLIADGHHVVDVPSSPPGFGCWIPVTDVRPTLTTRTQSPLQQSVRRNYVG